MLRDLDFLFDSVLPIDIVDEGSSSEIILWWWIGILVFTF